MRAGIRPLAPLNPGIYHGNSQRAEEALSAIGWMSTGKIIGFTQELALSAAVLSMEYKLPMADSMILATARAQDATLWTQDEHFKDLEGVRYIEKK